MSGGRANRWREDPRETRSYRTNHLYVDLFERLRYLATFKKQTIEEVLNEVVEQGLPVVEAEVLKGE